MLWITGVNGLLGSAFSTKNQIGTGHEVDIGNLAQVRHFLEQHPTITKIINCAAYSDVEKAQECSLEAYRTNAIGPENLALAANQYGKELIHLSTDYVFKGDGAKPLKEEDPVGPVNYYGQTKLEGEKRALALGALVIRTSWIFGNGGKTFGAKLYELMQKEKEIRLTDDQWGRFTYAPDLASAILQMFGKKGLYQYANQGVATRYDFGLAMREEALALGLPVVTEAILPAPSSLFATRCKRPRFSPLDTTKIEQYVSIRPWREALRGFLCVQRTAS